ncbi:MAG: Uma2 family endonuclease [Cyanobacteriota bacterium]|nr:Uma2 family endonuclease [Cyanobacteriota bacterium]
MTVSIAPVIQTEFPKTLPKWQPASWEDYLAARDEQKLERVRLFFHQGHLLAIDMGWEGIDHATISDLFTMLFYIWFAGQPEKTFSSLGRCLLEKASTKVAAAPDLVLYLGDNYPRREPGATRRIDLDMWRIPDLVGEISDTTLASDLDEKKHLYATLQIPEYWVIDVRVKRIFAFQLQSNGKYEEAATSLALTDLPISLLEQTLARLNEETNGSAALWFSQQIANLKPQ